MHYTILILLRALPAWLQLNRAQRGDFFEKEIMPIFAMFSKTLKIRMFDAEAFHAKLHIF